MPSSEEQQLLRDVLRNADYAAFRAEVYEMSLAEFNAGRKRPVRAILMAVAAVALGAALIVLTLRTEKELRRDPRVVSVAPAANNNDPGVFLVKSSPLPPNEVVRSVPDRSQIVETQASGVALIPFIRSNPATLSPMQDTELLALFTSDSLGFLRTGKGESLYYFAIGRRSRLE